MWRKIFSGKKQAEGANIELEQTAREDTLEEASAVKVGFFDRLKQGLTKTKDGFVGKVEQLVKGRKIDEALFEDLEEILIQADVGFETTMLLTDKIRQRVEEERISDGGEIQRLLKEEIVSLLTAHYKPLTLSTDRLASIMVVGVNGAGKTTTIGKLAYRFKQEKAKVLLGAGDTFRAAAIDQLQVWANRVGVDIVAHQEGSDPGAVAYDTVAAAKARKADVMILDTAGRLQTKTNLMAELGKVHRVVVRELGHELDEVLLVVDATTGQNALSQARLFKEAVPLTGIVLTKLDGTAKGGIILALANELELPVKLIGVGEQYTDLQDFDPEQFVEALFN
ncbi:MAG: signal recognition particle-docking protein FtsY [Firmicutes bacterium]|nr:signal recognition particle-docking protein FtsY [Bacillota bacterium]